MSQAVFRFLDDESGHAPVGYAIVSVLALGVVYTALAGRDVALHGKLDGYLQALQQVRTTNPKR